MAIFKELSSEDVKTSRAFLNQLIDVLQEDISGSTTRRKYQVYVTGGIGPGVTSSQFQTVYDQDFSLQTANPVLDMTFGLYSGSSVVTGLNPTIDGNGKYIFPSQSMMMREKMDMYREMAQQLLGNAGSQFSFTSGSTNLTINEPLFIAFKRLFARDQIKRETFAIQLYQTASSLNANNVQHQAISASIYTDLSSSVNKDLSFGGQVSAIVNSANTNQQVGLLYIDRGVAVIDTARVFDTATSGTGGGAASGPWTESFILTGSVNGISTGGTVPFTGSFAQFLASGSMDNIIDHIASTRFSSGTLTAMTFQNITNINSTLFFCRTTADEFNYSSNPTFTDTNNRLVVIDPGQEESQRTFSFITSIGLYDANDNLLAVAKLSRPVLKDDERDLTFKVRLDF